MESSDFVAYGKLPWYPHMAVADSLIWERFLVARPAAFDSVAYDVAIGQGAEFDATAGGILGAGIKRLYQKRIDVVARRGDEIWLIELKPRASTAAVGQLQGYEAVFKRDHPQYKQVKLLIITDSLMPDMEFIAQRAGIELIVV